MQGSATELHWEARLGVLLVSSSKEATRAVNLGGPKIGGAFQPLATFRSRSKQISLVTALNLAQRRRKWPSGGQSFEHLKDPVKNLKGDLVKIDQHNSGEDGLDWWEVTHSYIRCINYPKDFKYSTL